MNKYDTNELINCFKITVDLEGIKKLEEYITTLEQEHNQLKDRELIINMELVKLQEENKRLKQWDCNKDSRNLRQRVANAKLIKENQELHNKIDKAIEFIKKVQYDEELKSYVYGLNATGTRKLLEILKDSDVDE